MTIITNQKHDQLNLICPRGHEWSTPILGLDWSGPVYTDRFCLTCGLPGHPPVITREDLDKMLTDEQMTKAGVDGVRLFLDV